MKDKIKCWSVTAWNWLIKAVFSFTDVLIILAVGELVENTGNYWWLLLILLSAVKSFEIKLVKEKNND